MNKQSVDRIWYAIKPLVYAFDIVVGVVAALHFWPVPTLVGLMLLGTVLGITVPPTLIILLLAWFVAVRLHRYDKAREEERKQQEEEYRARPPKLDNSDLVELLRKATEEARAEELDGD